MAVMRRAPSLALAASAFIAVAAAAGGQPPASPGGVDVDALVLDEHPAIRYLDTPPRDVVAALQQEVAAGGRPLAAGDPVALLRQVLVALDVPSESQVLVFSRTGIQRAATSPRTPRAIYFNERVAVGYIAGAQHLELAAHDPAQGVQFYTLDLTAARPEITRRTNCLACHVSAATLEVPGMIARSTVTDADGGVLPQLGGQAVDHRTPLAERWGGWFITGTYDQPAYRGVSHRGNVTTMLHPSADRAAGDSNEVFVRWLASDPEAHGYLSAESDLAAAMVFDHQMHAVNLITRLQWEAPTAKFRAAAGAAPVSVSAQPPVARLIDELADYLVFVDAAAPPAGAAPRREFARWLAAAGPHDRRGRSLRELDLPRRLFRYSCSYMVYSPAFGQLPDEIRTAVWTRISDVLAGRDRRAKYQHIGKAERGATREILRATIPDLPPGF